MSSPLPTFFPILNSSLAQSFYLERTQLTPVLIAHLSGELLSIIARFLGVTSIASYILSSSDA